MKSQIPHNVRCNITGEAAEEIWHWSLLGVKGLNVKTKKRQRQETENFAWILTDKSVQCTCGNMNCAQGKRSLHSRCNFISTFTELRGHSRERWPTEVTSNAFFSRCPQGCTYCSMLSCASRLVRTREQDRSCFFSCSSKNPCRVSKT